MNQLRFLILSMLCLAACAPMQEYDFESEYAHYNCRQLYAESQAILSQRNRLDSEINGDQFLGATLTTMGILPSMPSTEAKERNLAQLEARQVFLQRLMIRNDCPGIIHP